MKLSPKDAAAKYSISVELIYRLCRERRLTHYRVGCSGRRGKILLDSEDMDLFFASCKSSAQELDDDAGPWKHIRP